MDPSLTPADKQGTAVDVLPSAEGETQSEAYSQSNIESGGPAVNIEVDVGGSPSFVTRQLIAGPLTHHMTLLSRDATDSAYGDDDDDRLTTTTSIASDVYHYRQEHGRTYHAYKDGAYFLPNDEREVDRLDLQHHIFLMTFDNKLFYAPIGDNVRHVLDVGTGTGIWALDFADSYPNAEVIGTDLSPSQPSFVSPNLSFLIDDAEDTWLFHHRFDFIHARLMAGSFRNWPAFIQTCYDNLEPGGWLELQDYMLPCESPDNSYGGTSLEQWSLLLLEASRLSGRPMDGATRYAGWMRDAGFTDVVQLSFAWPTNPWPRDPKLKEIGRWNLVNMQQGLQGFSMALLTRALGWSKEEVDVFVAKVRNDMGNKEIHAYFRLPVVYGRKPL